MARLKEFRFIWSDAWHQIDDGYDSILETAENGAIFIKVLVNLIPFSINLTDREDSFIADLEDIGVPDWDQKEFSDPWVFDGDIWTLSFTYDSRHIITGGMNGYPSTFPQFLQLLHDKYELPRANIDNNARILRGVKHIKISEITHKDYATYI